MLSLAKVTQDIEHWIENFVEVPHPALGGWPPCPYARSVRLKNSYSIKLGSEPYTDLKNIAKIGLDNKEVVLFVYDAGQCNNDLFDQSVQLANEEFLVKHDLLALADHPNSIEMVNGVCMNQGTYALILVQSVSKLDAKAKDIAANGYYNGWPEIYLQQLFQHRQDPRT